MGCAAKYIAYCITCDAPARQLLRYTKGRTGFYSCERYTVKGERHDHTMTFAEIDCTMRNEF